jgi:hypothetical protein
MAEKKKGRVGGPFGIIGPAKKIPESVIPDEFYQNCSEKRFLEITQVFGFSKW